MHAIVVYSEAEMQFVILTEQANCETARGALRATVARIQQDNPNDTWTYGDVAKAMLDQGFQVIEGVSVIDPCY